MRLPAIIISISLLTAGHLVAQGRTTAPGWSLYPSGTVGVHYDDNLFFRRDRSLPAEGVFYTQLGLNLDAIHRGRTSSFRGGYGLEGEYFTGETEELTQVPSDHRAHINFSTSVGQRNTLGTSASYNVSRRPNRVFEDVDVELGRQRAEGYSASVQFNRQLTPKNSLGTSYSFGYRKLDSPRVVDDEGDFLVRESLSHQASMGWTHTIGEKTGGTLQYAYRVYESERNDNLLPGLAGAFQSHTATYGWTLELGPQTSITVSGGPIFFQDLNRESLEPEKIWRITPEGRFSFDHDWERTNLNLSYRRAQSQFVGSTGSIITDQVSATFGVTPARRLSLSFSTGASRSTRGGDVFETYRARVSGSLAITRWWSLNGNYGFTSQDRGLRFAGDILDPDAGRINRNRAYIGITIGKTVPLE